jgi:hypothetical protein
MPGRSIQEVRVSAIEAAPGGHTRPGLNAGSEWMRAIRIHRVGAAGRGRNAVHRHRPTGQKAACSRCVDGELSIDRRAGHGLQDGSKLDPQLQKLVQRWCQLA